MNVLALASYPIEVASTRYRVSQFVQPLAEQGITLNIRPFLDSRLNATLYQRSQWPRTALGLTRAALRRLTEVWQSHDADVIFVQREAMMFGPPLIEWLAMQVGRCPLVLDLDDATYVRYRSPTYGRVGSSLKWFRKTNDLIRWSRLVTCGNNIIADYVTKQGREAVVIPTVVDTDQFRPAPRANDVPVIGWIGTHSTFQYLKPLFPLFERLAREHKFRLKLVGTGEAKVAVAGVEVENLAWNLEREIADFQSIDIGLYPIREDDWSVGKSGFKAIQYMAVGVPFVTAPVGTCAEIARPGVTHFLARSDDEWCDALSRLLADQKLREQMGAAGRQFAEEHYTLRRQADKLGDALRRAATM